MTKKEFKISKLKIEHTSHFDSDTMTEQFKSRKVKIEHVISIMNIYLEEWIHRNGEMWELVFKYFYVTLIVLFLPNLVERLGIGNMPNLPQALFPAISIGLSLYFLYVSIGYAKRLEAIGNSYQKMIDLLPEDLRRMHICDDKIKYGKYFKYRMGTTLCCVMFIFLIFLALLMIFYYLG